MVGGQDRGERPGGRGSGFGESDCRGHGGGRGGREAAARRADANDCRSLAGGFDSFGGSSYGGAGGYTQSPGGFGSPTASQAEKKSVGGEASPWASASLPVSGTDGLLSGWIGALALVCPALPLGATKSPFGKSPLCSRQLLGSFLLLANRKNKRSLICCAFLPCMYSLYETESLGS